VNQNLAVFSLSLDRFDFRYCSIILCLPLRKQRLGNENQLILILAGLLYCTVLEWVRIIVTSGSRAYLLFKQSAC
jgi:hypothetical protein